MKTCRREGMFRIWKFLLEKTNFLRNGGVVTIVLG
jgi:hypothetical protein